MDKKNLNITPNVESLDFNKLQGLIPAVIQDYLSGSVLMVGFMNEESYKLSVETGFVHFFSRTKNRVWKKGETSGNTLEIKSLCTDCDKDTILIHAKPKGPTCHTGQTSCFTNSSTFLDQLQNIIKDRKNNPSDKSYTSQLFKDGIKRIAQKIGEEGVEVAIAGLVEDDDKFLDESADLLFHLLVLLEERNLNLSDILNKLENRKSKDS